MKLVTAAEMRDMERLALEAGTSLDDLMEAAGLAVAQEAWLSLGVVAGRRILVLAGSGNNGGDGLVAARHLAEWGADVVVYLVSARRDPDPKLEAVREAEITLFEAASDPDLTQLQQALDGAEMVIDAILGTGRSRPIDAGMGGALGLLRTVQGRAAPPKIMAVDVPTGVDADTGHADPLAVRADMTVTLGLAKVGLYILPGSEHAGHVQVVDIGLPPAANGGLHTELLTAAWTRDRLAARPKDANKGTFGRVLVVGGSHRYPGATRLAAEACYRSGAGLVTIACSARVQSMIAPGLAEATYLPYESDTGALTMAATREIIESLRDYDVLLVGPGLSQAPGVREAVIEVLAEVPDNVRACVVDADALNALAATDGWPSALAVPCVLTPHPGEMARLSSSDVAAVQSDRLRAATDAASAWGQVVALKGAHTVIAAADGRAAISPHANALLASAGTGDVLAGAIAGLVAQGLDLFDAAACGVFLHGIAAEDAGGDLRDRGLLASDLLPALPRAIRTVREGKVARLPAPPFPDLESLAGALSPQ